MTVFRVQNISKIDLETSEIDFEPLAEAIKAAQTASGKLDKRRHKALKRLHKLMRKLEHGKGGIVKTMLRGCGWRTGGKEVEYNLQTWEEGPKEGIFPFPHPKLPFPLPTPRKYREINNILKEIRIINKKLQNFECGFLSEDGLKVGVAHSLLITKLSQIIYRIENGISIRGLLQVFGSVMVPQL